MIAVEVALGLVPPPMPPILTLDLAYEDEPPEPPLIIEGVLHQGNKMVLGGTSKANKTWSLLDLGVSVASGAPWWGHNTTRSTVLYINFELPRWAITRRIRALCAARPEVRDIGSNFQLWNLRGRAANFAHLRPELERGIAATDLGLIILDPAYKLLGDRDENANGDIGDLMNQFERLSESTGAALVIAHHFAKGDSSVKDAIDRMAGAGAWARDPDSIMVMTPHEEENCYTVTSILRCLPQMPEFVLEWQYPLMKRATDLDPSALRRRGATQKACTDREFLDCIPAAPASRKLIVEKAHELGLSTATIDRYLKRLVDLGIISSSSGLYWRKD
jgi:hypothetical protein